MKHRYIAKRFWNSKTTPISKTNEYVKRYDDVIDLSIGDPDIPADKSVIENMCRDALTGHTKYTDFLGDMELRTEICNWFEEDYECSYSINNIMITSGGTHAMYLLLTSILDEGDEVIIIAPYYTYYEPQIILAQGKPIEYNTLSINNFELDLEGLKEVISYRTRAIIINSPNNPTGKVYEEKTIQGLLELANEYDFLIIADEIYNAINFTNRKKPICAYNCNNPRIVTIYSFSKDYSMTGFRLGFIMGESGIIECVKNVNEAVNFTINSIAQRAGIYAIKDRKKIQKVIYNEYKKKVFYTYERIKLMKNIKCNPPEGTFYLFPNIADTGLSSMEIWEKILDDAHVLVLPGISFGNAGENHIRISCTVQFEKLKEAFDRLQNMNIFK